MYKNCLPLESEVGEAVLDNWCEILLFILYNSHFVSIYQFYILKTPHISFSSSPSASFKEISPFLFLPWHLPAPTEAFFSSIPDVALNNDPSSNQGDGPRKQQRHCLG